MTSESPALIDRYLLELRTYLPGDVEDEVVEELRTTLRQRLDERRAEDPELSSEQVQVELLRELGPPHVVADGHVPRPRVLFGPRLYPAFFRTIKISIAVLTGLAAIGVYFDFARTRSFWSLGPALLSALGTLLTGSVMVIAITVLVFYLIERSTAAFPESADDWDPASLEPSEDPDRVALGDRLSSIAFLVVALIVLNVFGDRIGAHLTVGEQSGWIPWLGPAFRQYLWVLNLALVLDLLVNFVVLARWRWTLGLRWAALGVNGLYVTFLALLVLNPPLLAIDPDWMVENGWSAEAAAEYESFVTDGFAHVADLNLKFVLAIACVGLAYSLFKTLRRTIGGS